MASLLTMITRPQAMRRTYPAVLDEVRKGLEALGKETVKKMQAEIAHFSDEHKPDFKPVVEVKRGKWVMYVKYDKRTEAGKVYNWVNEGTGMQGGKRSDKYIITAKRSKYLHFFTPFIPKTKAFSGNPPASSLWPEGEHFMKSVQHPGIDPRHFNKNIEAHLASRQSGSFRNVVEAGVKRGFRRSKGGI